MALQKLSDVSGDREFVPERNMPLRALAYDATDTKHLLGYNRESGFYYKCELYSHQSLKQGNSIT